MNHKALTLTRIPVCLVLLSCLPLAACGTTAQREARADREEKISAVLEKAAEQASSQGQEKQSLEILERMYKRDSASSETAMKYAVALREAGRLNRAVVVLSPFVEGDGASSAVLTEYASTQASLGAYPEAEANARRAILVDSTSGQAYHILGIALDAQGHNQQAEVAFRKGLENWQGDPGPILNNLGLNLATQGFLDEAIDTLRRAVAVSPNRPEIERNLRIVTALQVQPPKSGMRLVPKPPRKPAINASYKGISIPGEETAERSPSIIEPAAGEDRTVDAEELPGDLPDEESDDYYTAEDEVEIIQ